MSLGKLIKTEGVIILSIIAVLSLNGCSGSSSPTGTTAASSTVQQTTAASTTSVQTTQDKAEQSKSILADFEKLRTQKSSISKLIEFIKPQISNMEKADLDTAVREILDDQLLQLKDFSDKIMADNFNIRMNKYKYEELVSLSNIKESDSDIKTTLQDAYNGGLKLSTSEGMYYLEVDYSSLKAVFAGNTSEEISSYLDIMAEESNKHFAEDAALLISYDQLAERVARNESFIKNYGSSKFADKVKELHKYYLSAYLLGLNNTPAFSMKDNILEKDVLDSYKASIAKYPGTSLSGILSEYMKLLEKDNYKRTQAILDYVSKVTKE